MGHHEPYICIHVWWAGVFIPVEGTIHPHECPRIVTAVIHPRKGGRNPGVQTGPRETGVPGGR